MGRIVGCLIDTGSQKSYIFENAAKGLSPNVNKLVDIDCDLYTYTGQEQETKSFKEMSTGIHLEDRFIFVPLLVDTTLDIKFEIPDVNAVVSKLQQHNIRLLNEEFYEDINHKTLQVDMLLAIDILQSISLVPWN